MSDPASLQLQSFGTEQQQQQQTNVVVLQTSNGAPVSTLTASMTVPGSGRSSSTNNNGTSPSTTTPPDGGYILLQDFTLLDHISHFDRERIPERVVHAKGAGAKGYFIVTTDIGQRICQAKLFHRDNRHIVTPITVRFSTVGGENGSADTVRDPRGFAIKFFTQNDGIWDLVGNNTPIFFIRDPILFPSFIHTQKRNPVTHLKDATMMWDFISLRHETCHQVSFLFSDRGIPNGYRCMNGYGSHTYKNVNAAGQAVYVKYHFKTDQGIQNLTVEQASQLASSDPDYAIRDLYNAIATGNYPSWTMYVQIMTYEQAERCSFNPFDITKVWNHTEYPLQEIGRIILNENPSNYYRDVEQIAFSPSHMIPGIEPSPDKMLQVRLFSYPDTHRYRLGTNYQQLPPNKASTPSNKDGHDDREPRNYQRDGPMLYTSNGGGAPNYYPNSFSGPEPIQNEKTVIVESTSLKGNKFDIVRTDTGDEDNYSQCRTFFTIVLNDAERDRLTTNIATSLADVTYPVIQQRTIEMFNRVHSTYGQTIQTKLQKIVHEKKKQQPSPLGQEPIRPLNPPRIIPPPTGRTCPYGYTAAAKTTNSRL